MTDLAEEPQDDLRGMLSDAFDAAETGEQSAPAPAPAAETPNPAEAATSAPRDQNGRFLPKPAEAPKTTDQPAAAGQEAAPPPILPPASWSAEAKSQFATLAPAIQAEIAKRESDVTKGFEERASQLKRYEPLEQVIGPHRERLALAGIDEGTYVRSLITADEMLRRPETQLQAIAQIAQGYGIDLRRFAGGQAQPQQAQQPNPYDQRIATLEQQVQQRTAAEEQAARHQNLQAVESFRADPANLYFENVKADMAALIKSGQAAGLKDAYEKAIWSRPDIRPLLLQQQATEQAAQAQATARAKTEQARAASGSITGSPTLGSAQASGASTLSIREELERSWAEHA